jgi:hypothetical protein
MNIKIAIDYDEGNQKKYRYVWLHWGCQMKKFKTGNIVHDWKISQFAFNNNK